MDTLATEDAQALNIVESLDLISRQINKLVNDYIPIFDGEHYLSNKQLSKLLHTNERTLHEYRNKGIISFIDSGKILYRESDVLKMLEKNYIEAWGR